MKKNLLAIIVAAAALSACNPEPASVGCPIQLITWAAKYTLVDTSHSADPCGVLTASGVNGESWGFQRYNKPGDPASTFAVRPASIGRTGIPATGPLPDEPSNGQCAAPTLTAPATNAAATVTYAISNVKFLATAEAPGSQFGADLAYTAGGCTANYKVVGVWPAIACNASDPTTGDPIDQADQTACAPGAPDINSGFNLTCIKFAGSIISGVPLYRCAAATDFPSVR